MKQIDKFEISSVPIHKIVFVTTSPQDYDMDRVIVIEDLPEYGEYTIVYGGHCSCYGFDDTTWEAWEYTWDELKKLLDGWKVSGTYVEKKVADMMSNYFQ